MHRFLIVGALNTLIDLSAYLALRHLGLPVLPANFLSTSAGMAFSYLGNRNFTFRSSLGSVHVGRQVLLFLAVTGVGLWALQPVVIVTTTPWLAGVTSRSSFPSLVFPKICGIAVGLVWNYILYSRLVFRQAPRS
jgi:putative flippase GtrA